MRQVWHNGAFALLLLIASAGQVCAEEPNGLKIELDQQVVYCEAELPIASVSLEQALQSGIAVTLVWHVQIAEVQEYWLNKSIADIKVSRRVVPDLLSRKWLLVDAASGISRQESSLQAAMQFLTRLEHFPVLDRSLLVTNTPYRVSIAIEKHEGEINEGWWAALWSPGQYKMTKDFTLP